MPKNEEFIGRVKFVNKTTGELEICNVRADGLLVDERGEIRNDKQLPAERFAELKARHETLKKEAEKAQREAEAARKKAEEDARRAAEEEAKRLSDEAAAKEAEEEAKRLEAEKKAAEEEAAKKAAVANLFEEGIPEDGETFDDDEYEDDEENKGGKWKKILLIAAIAIIAVALGLFAYVKFFDGQIGPFGGQHIDENATYVVAQSKHDIVQGAVLTEDMFQAVEISGVEYAQLNDTTIVSGDGTTNKTNTVLYENLSSVLGKFAARDIAKGTYITTQDFTGQKVVAEKTYVEVEVNGETISVPVDASVLQGNTRVKIVALITTEGQEGTVAVALSEFVLEDRTLQAIFDSAGSEILSQLAQQNEAANNATQNAADSAAQSNTPPTE